ncbi:MAG TPA: hypothetical protein PKZ12_00375 [Smithellaceae bacterium]|nr:hypothetical protein [Smithellaceae bacterium]
MNIAVLDASLYFKGLLLLIRKDHKISNMEAQLMKRIGKSLGFEKAFCNRAIREIMDNKFIEDVPPRFSSAILAMKFIKDGLSFSLTDNVVHPREEEWLLSVALTNGLSRDWFLAEKDVAEKRRELPEQMEVDDLEIDFTQSAREEKNESCQ